MVTCPACGYGSEEGFRFCPDCGTKLGTATLREVRRTVTSVFCDLVGSTSLGETHDPEVLRPLLHGYFAEMREAVERHGGEVQKFIGDAVVAVFGLPVAHEDDALRAVRAAVEMQERLARLNEGSPVPLTARVGVTTGEVLVPADGEPIVGDTMNTAARLQSAAPPGGVLIGDPTWRLVRDAVVAEAVEPIEAKGKAEPVPAFRVVQVASLSPVRTRRLDAPMIGREREAILLAQALERVGTDRSCQLFTVLGTAGAGKSRLVEEFLGGITNVEVLQGRCLPYGEGITYYPVTEALKGALGLADFDEEARVRDAIAAAVRDEEHAGAITANLARLFGAGEGNVADETFWAVRRFLETRGRDRPLVVVFDDVHWGEETFLDLVTHIAEWSRDASILVLCMARSDLLDVRPGWSGGLSNATTISLAPLTDAECASLIDHLLGSAALPEEIRARITTVAEGNPLFVEEMLRMLVDDELLTRDGDRWTVAGNLASVQVPSTISALLSARLDRLSAGERAVIERAAVVGKVFHRGAVAELLPEPDREHLDTQLRSLTRKELITPERSTIPGQDAYRFRHLLIRDAAYDQIPKAERGALHVAFADWLEVEAGERIAEQEEIVGYHLERAYRYRQELGLPEDRELKLRAARALGEAGMRASKRGDVPATIDLLTPAVELADGEDEELDRLRVLAQAMADAARFDELSSVLDRLLAAARRHGDRAVEALARLFISGQELRRDPTAWDPVADDELADRTLEVFRSEGRFIAMGLLWKANGLWSAGRMDEMLDVCEQMLDVATTTGSRREVEFALSYQSTALQLGSAPLAHALERTNAWLDDWSEEPPLVATLLSERAFTQVWMGRSDVAVTDADAAAAILRDLGRARDLMGLDLVRGYAAWSSEDLVAAEAVFRGALDIFRQKGDQLNAWFVGIPLARCLLDEGRNDEVEGVTATFAHLDLMPAGVIQGRSIDAVIAARRGNLEEALRLSDEAQALAATTDFAVEKADAALDRAEVLLLAGRPDEARASAEDALARFEHKEYVVGIRRARAFLDRL